MIRNLAKKIRHSKAFEGQEWIWTLLRKPYHLLIDPLRKGVKVRIGGVTNARIPADMTGKLEWERYEQENLIKFRSWLRGKKNPLIMDIGSSFGVFTLVALAENPESEVVAFEPDLNSLKALQHLVGAYSNNRLTVIQGLISERQGKETLLKNQAENTVRELAKLRNKERIGATRFICLNDPLGAAIPVFSLDELTRDEKYSQRPMLLKIDVEGAELMVVRGARELIRRYRPEILLSAHPPALPTYGHSMEELEREITQLGYQIDVVSEDHEIHWFCSAKNGR
jgi:FkbM family methyltransferase